MPLNLPNNPTIGQTVTEGSRAWFWNGRYWQATSLNVGYTGSQGDLGFTGSKGEQGNFGGVTLDYTYSDDTDSTLYPGAGRLKFNTRDMTQSQSLIIADSDDNTINLDSYLSTIAASTSDIRGHFKVTKKSYPEFFVMFAITGEIDTFDDYYVVPCSFVSGNLTDSSTAFEAEDDLLITFARTGDKGDTGYTGSQGAAGASVRLLGSVNTLQDLPQSPDVGDGYLVTDTGDLYIWNGSQYTNVGKITGETGPLGYTGSQGDQGPIGYTGSSGSGDVDTFRAASVESGLSTVEYAVTVAGPQGSDSGNKYIISGAYKPTANFVVGYIYVFNQDDATNVYFPNANGTTANPHPLNFSADNLSGELGGGTSYLTNVQYFLDDVAVTQTVYNSSSFETATTRRIHITVTSTTPSTLYYWCYNHTAMGNNILVAAPGSGGGGESGIGYTGSAGLGLDPWMKVTEDYTATGGNRIIADTTTGSFTITLPANPVLGSSVLLTDGNDWGTNQLIISGNGNDVEGVSTDIGIDVPGVTVELIYDGDQWQITATLGTGGIGVPPGGTTGQVLAKISDIDYETDWINVGAGAITRYLNLSLIGDIAPPSTGNARFYPPENITITRVHANVSLAPTGGSFTFVIKKNGVSLLSSFSVASGQFTMNPVTVNISVTTADYLTVDTTGVGTSNLNIKMEYTT